ncbi:AMP-binding protein [Streptomyces phaeochromogenes]
MRAVANQRRGGIRPCPPGVRHGDVVAVPLPNRLEFVYVLAAVVRSGAVFCQFPPDYRAREIAFILRVSGAHTLVVPDRARDYQLTGVASFPVSDPGEAHEFSYGGSGRRVGQTAANPVRAVSTSTGQYPDVSGGLRQPPM